MGTPDSAPSAPLLRGLTRRRFLGGVLGLGSAAALSACSTPGLEKYGLDARAATDLSSGQKVVNWSNWPEYVDVNDKTQRHPSLDQFKKATGLTVRYTEDVTDNDVIFAKLKPALAAGRDTGRDLVVVTDWMIERMIRLTWAQEIDHGNIPNLKNLEPTLLNVSFDKGRKFSIPWQSGFTGVAYNPKATDGVKVTSVDQLLHDKRLKGKVTLLTELRDTVGLTMLAMGKDPSDFQESEFYDAIDVLRDAKAAGQIQGFTGNEYGQGLAAGDIAACMAWTGDVVQLQADNPHLGYVLPKAGHMLWSDNFFIPNQAAHKTNAEKLINWYYQPKIAAEVEDYVNYIPTVVGVQDILVKEDPDVAKNPLIFPDAKVRSTSHVFQGVSAQQDTEFNRAFQALIGG
jgi:spermidine/putrescine transport system substrate-binding protein